MACRYLSLDRAPSIAAVCEQQVCTTSRAVSSEGGVVLRQNYDPGQPELELQPPPEAFQES